MMTLSPHHDLDHVVVEQLVAGGVARWEYIDSKRPHTHDVRALTVVGGVDAEPLLVSGGNDAQLFAYSVRAFTKVPPKLELIP